MDTPKLYVACLAAAYTNGVLFGKWIAANQTAEEIYAEIYQMLAESPIKDSEEFAILDFRGFWNLHLDKYTSIESIAKIAAFVIEYGELGAELLGHYSIKEARRLLKDHYHGAFDNEVDFAYELIEKGYTDTFPEKLKSYFDYVAFTQDLFMNDYFAVEVGDQTHVFSYE